jgi:predicted esterase
MDPVIPIDFGRRARDQIAAAGGELLYEEYPLPHTLDPGFVMRVRDWLAAKLVG